MTTWRARHVAAIATLVLAAGGCGKKGPPLPPFVRIPAAVDTIAAARVGSDIYLTLTVPAENVDMSMPGDVARLEVYGYTGAAPPPRARWIELGKLVATIPVSALPVTPPGTTPPPPTPPGDPGAVYPGNVITVVDTLEADELLQGPVATTLPSLRPGVEAPVPARTGPLRRFYIAIPFSERGRPGPPGQQVDVVLTRLPEPPTGLRATYDTAAVSLNWDPSGGLLGFLLERALAPEIVPFDVPEPPSATSSQDSELSEPEGPTTYRVYRDVVSKASPPPANDPAPAWRSRPPAALNEEPLVMTTWQDQIDFGVERCYTVRAQRGGVLSEPSPRVCIAPSDTFPPAVPTGLATVPSDGAINLIWEPNTERDLGGYLVLRQGPGDATLRQLTTAPIADARYRDAAVEAGARYSYAVVAVDRQAPRPNASAPSATVDDIAR